MDKIIENSSINNIININERKAISITGVKKIESFDPEEFLLNTNLGVLLLKGEGLEIIKLDTLEGHVAIKGQINSLSYVDSNKNKSDTGIISKLFK